MLWITGFDRGDGGVAANPSTCSKNAMLRVRLETVKLV
jgi:hypothetical protein